MASARGNRWPSAQDLDLFHKVLADVTPLRSDPPPFAEATSQGAKQDEKTLAKKSSKKPVKKGKPGGLNLATPKSEPTKITLPAALADHGAGRTPGLDKRTALRLQRGKTEIDGRIDLHGMTQMEARSALTRYVTSGFHQGRRCLLVITGKGRRPLDQAARPWTGESGIEPGVLRRMVPRWLEEAPLVGCVLAYSAAQPRDGGSGALYVLLKRRRDP